METSTSPLLDAPDAPDAVAPAPSQPVALGTSLRLAGWAGAAGLATLAGCGGGGGAGAAAPAPAPATPASAADAGRFLAQATLGYNRADLDAMASVSYSDWIDAQFAAPPSQGHYCWPTATTTRPTSTATPAWTTPCGAN